MNPVNVVSDTTALTTLLKCGLEWVLPRLFTSVLIPAEVEAELRAFHPELPGWCEVRPVTANAEWERLTSALDAGEAAAIALALEVGADAILLDDRKGRRHAEGLGLTCLAVPAVLLAAKREGLIPSLSGALELLAEKGRCRVTEDAAAVLLRAAGEA